MSTSLLDSSRGAFTLNRQFDKLDFQSRFKANQPLALAPSFLGVLEPHSKLAANVSIASRVKT